MRKFFSILGFVCAQAHIRARAKNRTKVLYFFEICNRKSEYFTQITYVFTQMYLEKLFLCTINLFSLAYLEKMS